MEGMMGRAFYFPFSPADMSSFIILTYFYTIDTDAFPKPGSLPGSDLPMSKSLWVSSAIRLLLDLQINRSRTVVAITDEQERGSSLFAWWLAALSDAHCGMIFRTMPLMYVLFHPCCRLRGGH